MICISIVEDTANKAISAIVGVDFAEIRIDKLKNPTAPEVRKIFALHKNLIATCRAELIANEKRTELLLAAIDSGAAYVDLEIENDEQYNGRLSAAAKKKKCKVIVSYHNKITPDSDELARIISVARKKGADIVKVACRINSDEDAKRLLSLLKEVDGLLVIGMGEKGRETRALAPLLGSQFTFAAKEKGKEAGPGQMTAQEIKDIQERMLENHEELYSTVKLFAVTGKPVLHSRSPQFHNAGYRELGINAVYLRLAAENAAQAIESARRIGISGMNITSPFKEQMHGASDSLSDEAKQMGVVNTVLIKSDSVFGNNTDPAGVNMPLLENGCILKNNKVVVIGAGGAAKAAVYGLVKEGARVVIANRTVEKARELSEKFGCDYCTLDEKSLETALDNAVALVSTADTDEKIVPSELLRNELYVLDAKYSKETRLTKDAKKNGCRIIDAREWLLYQGIEAFERFTGKRAPIFAMRTALYSQAKSQRTNIALIGMMGSGKSSTAKELADLMGLDSIDLDQQIETKVGRKISTIFAESGEPEFRRLEHEELVRATKLQNKIISCGGGIILDPKNRELLNDNCITVWLWAGPSELAKRTMDQNNRPLLDKSDTDKIQTLNAILRRRKCLYAKASDLVVDTTNKTPAHVARIIVNEFHKMGARK